jgi:hypothetical protein
VGGIGILGPFKIGNVYRHSNKNVVGRVLKQIKCGVGAKSRQVFGCADSAFGMVEDDVAKGGSKQQVALSPRRLVPLRAVGLAEPSSKHTPAGPT